MKLIKYMAVLLVLVISLSAQQKYAQSGFKFLQVTTDAKVAAMGDAATALEGNSMSVFSNSAGLARQTSFLDVSLGNVQWIGDIKYYYGVASVSPDNGAWGVFALSFVYTDYGDVYKTAFYNDSKWMFQDLGTYKPSIYYVGLSYAKAFSDKFSIGANIKMCKQDLGSAATDRDASGNVIQKSYSMSTPVFDFGMLYHTGFQSLDFGASFKNFSPDMTYERESFEAPLNLKVGLAYNWSDLFELNKAEHSLQMAVDFSKPRDFKEQVNLGLEYKFMDMVSLRVGYSTPNDEHGITTGIGLQKEIDGIKINIDYSYVPWTVFSDVHQLSLHFAF